MRHVLIAAATGLTLIATPAAAQFGIYVGPAAPYGAYGGYTYDYYGNPPAYGYYGSGRVYGYEPSYGYVPTYQPSYGYYPSYGYPSYGYAQPMRRHYYGGPKWDW